MPVKIRSKTAKVKALLEEGTLNPTPEKVRDPKFQENEFFDPHDLVQVKYEMLRRVSVENASVTAATEEYGVSRPTYYQTKASFDKGGVAGLVPRKRGPHGPHKLQGEALAFVQQQLVAGEPVRARELAKLVRQKFDLDDPPQDDRASGRRKKNSRDDERQATMRRSHPSLVTQYETLRAAALGECAAARGSRRAAALSPPWHVGLGAGGGHHACDRSGRPAPGHRTGRHRKSTEPSFTSSPPWSSMPIITEQHHE